MRNNNSCQNAAGCLGCEYAKFRSLFRGRVPMRCKMRCFSKYIDITQTATRKLSVNINTNLTNASFKPNSVVKGSLQHKLHITREREQKGLAC